MAISLRAITKDNWLDCIALGVKSEQTGFVAPNLISLIQAQLNPSWVPLAIYDDDKMVGFVMYGKKDGEEGVYWILRIMIDRQHQQKGYGKTALQAVIDLLRQTPDCREIKVTFQPENIAAEKLYLSAGFQNDGYTRPWLCAVLTGMLTGRPWTIA